MPIPVITNPYSLENFLTAYLNEPFSVKLAISNTPTRLDVIGNWIGWSHRWLAGDQSVELFITPKSTLIDKDGISIVASNSDGSSPESIIPYEFIKRVPIIDNIPDRIFSRGQKNITYSVAVRNSPSVVSIVGDLIGLAHKSSEQGIGVTGNVTDDYFTVPSGTYRVNAANESGSAVEKIGRWSILSIPYKPTGLTAIPGSDRITFGWDTVLSYPVLTEIQVRVSSKVVDIPFTDWVTIPASSTNYIATDVGRGESRYFQVRGVNQLGTGIDSEIISAMTASVPAAPRDLVAYRGNRRISLRWKPPTDDGGIPILRYEYRLGSGAWKSIGSTDTSFTITNLQNGTQYSVRVRAVNTAGNSSVSNQVRATPAAVPSEPTQFSAEGGDSKIILMWQPPTDTGGSAITGYEFSINAGTAWSNAGNTAGSLSVSSASVTTRSEFYDSGTVSVVSSTTVHIGRDPSDDISIEQKTINTVAVYQATADLTDLLFRITHSASIGTILRIRYSSTAPTNTNYLTHGTRLLNVTVDNPFDQVRLASMSAGTYFWICLPDGNPVTFRRLRINADAEASGLMNGVRYDCMVRAINSVGAGIPTEIDSVKPGSELDVYFGSGTQHYFGSGFEDYFGNGD